MCAVEGEGDRVGVGVEVTLARFKIEGVGRVVAPFQVVRRVRHEGIKVVAAAEHAGDIQGVCFAEGRGDEHPAAVALAKACHGAGNHIRPQRLPADGLDLRLVERAADDDRLAALSYIAERLPALDADGGRARIGETANGDAVVGVAPAEGDRGRKDFVGGNSAAVDGDIAGCIAIVNARVVASGVNGAAIDGQIVVGEDAVTGACSRDGAAVDGHVRSNNAVVIVGNGGKASRAFALAVEGKTVANPEGCARAIADVHRCAVAEDEVGIVRGDVTIVNGNAVAHHIPTIGEVAEVEIVGHYGVGDTVLLHAVLVDVGDGGIGEQGLAADGLDLLLVERAADDDRLTAVIVYVIERLPALDADGTFGRLVAANKNVVVGVRPTKNEIKLGMNAIVYTSSVDGAAVDGHIAIYIDAISSGTSGSGIDGAAVDDYIAIVVDGLPTSSVIGVDDAAVDDYIAPDALLFTRGIDGAAVEGETCMNGLII